MKFIKLLPLLLLLFAHLASAQRGIGGRTVYDEFLLGVSAPQLDAYAQIGNLTGYTPNLIGDKVEVKWMSRVQTGWDRSLGEDTPRHFDSPESPHGIAMYVNYKYQVGFWASISHYLPWLGGISEMRYPFIPPFVVSKVEFDCDGDGRYEREVIQYKKESDNSNFNGAIKDLIEPFYVAENTWTKFEPPIPARSLPQTCFYDYDSNAKYGFTANFTVKYHIAPNYASVLMYSSGQDRADNIWPGYYFNAARIIEGNATTPGGFDLAECGNPGLTTTSDASRLWQRYWLPHVEPGCKVIIKYPVTSTGVGAPEGGDNEEDGDEEQSAEQRRGFTGEEKTVKDCHERWEGSEGNLKQCLMAIAFKDLEDGNNILGFGISIIRMVFSFLLLLFYIVSISIIGFVFAVIIPGVFRKIMLIFSRATRLK